jgi:GR25 family glycosyltransferase involved in LPS biosynthesis
MAASSTSPLAGIIIINLDRRPDRLRRVMNYLSASDLNAVSSYRLPAHDGSKIQYDNGLVSDQGLRELAELRRSGIRDFHAQLSVGAIGCYLSHIDAWRFVAEQGKRDPEAYYLILEDDARVPQAAKALTEKGWQMAKAASAGKPFLLLGHIICLSGCGRQANGLIVPDRFWSFQAYYLNGQTATALLEAGMFPIDVQIDSQVLYYRNQGVLNIYAYNIMQDAPIDTDIQVNIRPNAPLDRFKVFTP